jgi:hypothetical protein
MSNRVFYIEWATRMAGWVFSPMPESCQEERRKAKRQRREYSLPGMTGRSTVPTIGQVTLGRRVKMRGTRINPVHRVVHRPIKRLSERS